jgi:hypothetical protein
MVRGNKSGPGTCTKCSKYFTDLLDHINKRHKDTTYTQEDLSSTDLLACLCGKVVLNDRGLQHHQVRFGCTARDITLRRRSQSQSLLNHRSASTASSSLSPVPSNYSQRSHPYRSTHRQSTSPLSSLPSTPSSRDLLLQSLRSTPADPPPATSVPLSLPDLSHLNLTQLPYIQEEDESEEEQETIEDPAWSGVPEGMDLDEVMEQQEEGGLPLRDDGLELNLYAELDEDGDVGDEEEQDQEEGEMERLEMLDAVDADAGDPPTSPTPLPEILQQPFMDGFHLLQDILQQEDAELWDLLGDMELDVDRWEVVLTPDEYLTRFKDSLAAVTLVNWIPKRKMDRTYHRGPGFDRWLLLGESVHQLWIHPDYKQAFFTQVDRYQTAQPGPHADQASTGRAQLGTSVFIHCLKEAGCDTIRIKAYGQKLPITDKFLPTEPADVTHRWASHNCWDIGRNFDSSYIWLFGLEGVRRRNGVTRYPMMVPGSRDYGTANLKLSHNGHNYSIKIYPRIVHKIKSFNSKLQGSVPRSLGGARKQAEAARAMLHNLNGQSAEQLGGFRIEVSVKAISLVQAVNKVRATPFMDPEHWLGIGAGPFSPTILNARLVTRDDLFANAHWVHQKITDEKLLDGDSNVRPTTRHIKILTDMLNSLGWHGGLRRPSKSLDPGAWWNEVEGPVSSSTELSAQLSELCQSDQQLKVLFTIARQLARAIPCQQQPEDTRHRYQVNNSSPFRVRCCATGCNHKLRRVGLIHWLVALVAEGVLNGDDLLDAVEEALGVERSGSESDIRGSSPGEFPIFL